MAREQALSTLPSAERRESRDARNDQGRDATPNGDVLILGNGNTTSQEEAMQRIASLSPIRQGKVLDIRRRIAAGTYELTARLDKAIDRVLEAVTA
jgi:anti-sigma28 factor (negative regulator of flagellin synthesis)